MSKNNSTGIDDYERVIDEYLEDVYAESMNNGGAKLIRMSWEDEMRSDLIRNKGFIVKETAFNSKDQKRMYGIHSPKFSTDWDDENSFAERYRCDCGKLQSGFNEGKICPRCGTEVTFKDVDLSMTGWILLGDYKIITPIYYRILNTIIGKKELNLILDFNPAFDVDGHIMRDEHGVIITADSKASVEKKKKKTTPFISIGLIEFYERFEEILDYYRGKVKNKPEKLSMIDTCIRDKGAVFSSCIPVYHSELRPVSIKGDAHMYCKADRYYNGIFSQSRLLCDSKRLAKRKKAFNKKDELIENREEKLRKLEYPNILREIQERVNMLGTISFEQISGKRGQIRNQVLGGRVDYSGRSVIIPDPSLRTNEIKICYLSMLELCRYEITGRLSEFLDIPYGVADGIWEEARLEFDERVYAIMEELVNSGNIYCDINRNPTINYGSYNTMKVVAVKKDFYEDYTMSMPISVLTAYNADFDGDTLNQFAIKSLSLIRTHEEALNPAKNMYISRNDGLYNNEMNLIKDEIIGLWAFNNL